MTSTDRRLWWMAAPFLAGVTLLVVVPFIGTAVLSLFRWDLVRPPRFEELGNYRELIDDPVFRISLRNSLLFLCAVVPIRLIASTGLALLFTARGRGVWAGRSAIFAPAVLPEAAYALVWLWLLNPIYGPVNLALGAVGLPTPAWLTEGTPARWAIVIMVAFQLGQVFAIALAARSLVPDELLEMSASCGAGRFATFGRVTLPLMAPALLLVTLVDVALGLHAAFVPALLVTEGGPPPYQTTYLPNFVYVQGFEYLRYGYAAAASVLSLVLTAAIAWLGWRVLLRWRAASASVMPAR